MTYIQVCHQDIFTEFEVHTYLHFNPKSDQKLDQAHEILFFKVLQRKQLKKCKFKAPDQIPY